MAYPRRRRSGAYFKLVLGAGLAALILIGMLVAGMVQFVRVQSSLDRQASLSVAAFAQHDRLLQVVNEETGVRGYVATGDARFLEIYYVAQQAWARDAASIASTQDAIPALQARVVRSLGAAQRVHDYFLDEIRLMRAGQPATAKRNLSLGKTLVDHLRRLDADVQREADAQLQAQREHTRRLAQAGFTTAIAFCVATVLWFLAFAVVLGRARSYRRSALRDSLTGAQNRQGAIAAIDAQVGAARPQGLALVFIDLDGFKKINDVYGHATGDAILQSVVSRLQGELREFDTVCRIGGDEFVCVIAPPASPEDARRIADRLRKAVAAPYTFAGDVYAIGCSIGVSFYPQHGTTAESLLARADSAMYAAKAAGGGVREATAVAQW